MPEPTNSVVTAMRVIERVSLDQPVGVSELAKSLDLPKTSAHRMLTTLRATGWTRQDASGAWSLTLRAAAVGRRVLLGPTVKALMRPVMQQLSASTTETVRLWLVEGDTFLVAEEVEGSHPVRPVGVEMSREVPMHTTAVGKAVLASWPEARFQQYLETPLVARTERTITDPSALQTEIATARERGYATAWNEAQIDVGGVAATVPLPSDQLAALAVTFPTHRLTDELVERFGAELLDAVARIRLLVTD